MIATKGQCTLDSEQAKRFHEDGFVVMPGFLSADEVVALREHYMQLHARAPLPGLYEPLPLDQAGGDILKAYPRIMHPHRFDPVTRRYLLDSRIRSVIAELLGEEPLAAQSMFYFKPPGAKGQGLHQDNFYLKVKPGTCMAAWIPLDLCDEENGALQVASGTHGVELECPKPSDRTEDYHHPSEVALPQGARPIPVRMNAGDCLFFGGNLIHGSYRNRSQNRWRRTMIFHYTPQSELKQVARFYQPLLTGDGRELFCKDANDDAGPCGGAEGNEA